MPKLKIDVYSHGICVKAQTPQHANAIARFSFKFVKWTYQYDYRSRQNYRVQQAVYAAATKDRSEVRYHRNSLPEFLEHLKVFNIGEQDIDITYHDPDKLEWPQMDVKMADGWNLRPKQEKVKEFAMTQLSGKRTTLIGLPPGEGKGLDLDTPVRIRNGWKRIGDLKVGDLVMSQDGSFTRVTDIFDNDNMESYLITFEDGRDCICDIEHRWEIIQPQRKRGLRTSSMKRVLAKFNKGEEVLIPLVNIERSDDFDKVLPKDPYAMGHECMLTQTTIPEVYLEGSHEQRQWLVNGLLNIYTPLERIGYFEYRTVNQVLALQLIYLLRSLGYVASYIEDNSGSIQSWVIRCDTLKTNLKITNIQQVANRKTRCIKVEHPSKLFVIKDHIVTHNTITMLGIGAEVKTRFVIILRPQYIERWVTAFEETWGLTKDEILTISGGKNLKALFQGCLDGVLDSIKAVIISNRTFQSFIKDFEMYGHDMTELGWPIIPQNYAQTLGARFVYLDEGHQDSHLNFKIALYTHCSNMITATGTLVPDDPFLKKMTFVQYPVDTRFMKSADDNHIAATAVFYKFFNPKAIRYKSNNAYNHGEFEKSMMRNKITTKNYFNLVKDLIDSGYMSSRKEGYKCLVFVYSIAMATELTKYLKEQYPDLDVRRYCEDDPYENLMEPDIRVSTVISAGTAVDVPGLSCAILTQSLSSSQSNLQSLGRLRTMKDGHTPRFYWLVCEDIDKHIDFHEKKRKLFKDVLKSYEFLNTGRKI